MTTELTWVIQSLYTTPEIDGQTDVVNQIHWSLNGVDGEIKASVYGYQPVPFNPEGDFTPYGELDEATTLQWLKDGLGEDAIARAIASVESQIAAQAVPFDDTPNVPWA